MRTTAQVMLLCPSCGGSGVLSERINAHESEDVTCTTCNGSGRVIEVTVKDIVPFTPNKDPYD